MSDTTRTCACTIQQYSQIIFDNPDVQTAANMVYQSKLAQVTAATSGTLSTQQASGGVMFKSNFERMQYLIGGQNQASCGVAKKAFPLGTN